MAIEQKKAGKGYSQIEQSLELLKSASEKAVELGLDECQEATNPIMAKSLAMTLQQFEVIMDAAVSDTKIVIHSLPASAKKAIEQEVEMQYVVQRLEFSMDSGIKDIILTAIESVINALPISKTLKIVITAFIALIRAIQSALGSGESSVVSVPC